MKADFSVRKGLEKPLLINGLQVKHYYLLLGVGAIIAILLLFSLCEWLDDKTSKQTLMVQLVLLLGSFWMTYRWFRSKAIVKKYTFSKEICQLSNRDILNYLR